MRDKRPVDELSIDELERILAIRRREARQERLRHLDTQGRRLPVDEFIPDRPAPPQQHEAAEAVPPPEPPQTYDITDEVPRFEDEPENRPRRKKKEHGAAPSNERDYRVVRRRRAVWDRALLLVEVLAVIGIAGVLLVGGYFLIIESDRIEALEAKSASIQRDAEARRPTPSPLPELRINLADYVLPGGHVYNAGLGEFNLAELPESIKPAAIAQLNNAPQAERVAPQPQSPVRIVIETAKVNVNASIYGGDDWYSLQAGVGHLAGSANPGEDRNMVLSAHNDIYGEIFRYIEHLEPGDEIRVQANNGRWYTYVVYERQVVGPRDVWVLEPGNEPIVTLITCHPYRVDTQRMIVFGRLKEDMSS